TTCGGSRPVSSAQRARRCINAMESPPPETATMPGHGAPAARRSSIAAKNAASRACFAAVRLARVGPLVEDGFAGLRIFCPERGKGGATFGFLARRDQRLAKLEHGIGRARRVGIFLDDFRETACGVGVILLHIRDVRNPVDRL